MTTAAVDRAKARAIIEKQLEHGEKVLNAPPKVARMHVSPSALLAAKKIFDTNGLTSGMRPQSVGPDDIKELMAAGVLERTGHARATRYQLTTKPTELIADASLVKRKHGGPGRPRGSGLRPVESRPMHGGVLTIGESEKAYIRENVRAYLALATSAEARKHEEKRQSLDILDLINSRAKEILKASRSGQDGPRVTPQRALTIAQEELAEDFETRLKRDFKPLMFEIFGLDESADTDMRTMRSMRF